MAELLFALYAGALGILLGSPILIIGWLFSRRK